MVQQLLGFSRKSTEENVFVSASQVCEDALELIKIQDPKLEICYSLDMNVNQDAVALGYDVFYQVLINCLFNAIDAIKARGRGFLGHIAITGILNNTREKIPSIEIRITDNGVGIPEDQLDEVCDPFFTTKDVGKGTGLGLSVSTAIIESVDGTLRIESIYEQGTSIVISLPLLSSEMIGIANRHNNEND